MPRHTGDPVVDEFVDVLVDLLPVAGHAVPALALRAVPLLGDDPAGVLLAAEGRKLVTIDRDGDVTLVGPDLGRRPGAMRTAALRGTLARALTGSTKVSAVDVARHRLAGLLAEPDPSALPVALDAARDELQVGDVDDAVALYEAVLTALDHGAEPASARVEALGGLASSLCWAGRDGEASALVAAAADAAVRSGDAIRLAAAALAWTGRAIATDDDPTNTALIDRALDALAGPGGDDERAPVLHAQLLGLRADRTVFADLPLARRLGDEALAAARATGDPETIVRNAYTRRLVLWHPATHDEVLDLAGEMVALSPVARSYPEFGTVTRLQVFFEQGDFAHFDAELRSMRRRVESRRGRFERVWLETFLAARALVAGRWADVGAHVRAARSLTAGFDYEVLDQLLLAQEMLAGWQTGTDLSGLVTSDALPAGPMRASWAACLLGLSAAELPASTVEQGLVHHLGQGIDGVRPDLTWGPVMACLSMAAVAARSSTHAALLFDALTPYGDGWAATGGAVSFGPFAWHLGRLADVLGRRDDAEGLFAPALARCEQADATPWVARVLLSIAALDPPGRRDDSARALALAESLGMVTVAAAARRLADGGAMPSLPAGLTDREGQVLLLVADGATNRDIAQRLSLSVKTVERHLLNAYTKLGVRNRSEATALIVRHGLGR